MNGTTNSNQTVLVVIKSVSKLGAIALSAFSVSTGYCRLDETTDQIAARYGQETPGKPGNNSPADSVKAYSFRGNIVVVYFRDGVSVAESYTKNGLYSANEIDEILGANAEGSQWKVVSQVPAKMERLDGNAVANYDIGHNFLLVAKSDFARDWDALLRKTQKPVKPF